MGQGPSAPGSPDTPFRVIGAGLPRTGTKSFARAITILLGQPVHDSGAQGMGGTKHQQALWLQVMELRLKKRSVAEQARLRWALAELMEGYTSTCDAPSCLLYEELMELFPDAVVIATTRNKQGWWKSVQHMKSLVEAWWIPYVVWPIPGLNIWSKWMALYTTFRESLLGGPWTVDTLELHENRLRKIVPGGKLFFYDVRDGWDPLCKILNVPVPDVPFPHDNAPSDGVKVQRQVFWTGTIAQVILLALAIGTASALYKYTPAAMRYVGA